MSSNAGNTLPKNIISDLISEYVFEIRRIMIFRKNRIAVYSDESQTTTMAKSLLSDAGHALGNGHGGQATTAREFVTCCVPICFD